LIQRSLPSAKKRTTLESIECSCKYKKKRKANKHGKGFLLFAQLNVITLINYEKETKITKYNYYIYILIIIP